MKLAAALALGIALATLTARADDPAKKTGSIVGSFEVVAGEDNGKPVPDEKVVGTTVRITDDRIVVADKEDKELYVAKYTLDTSKTPSKITMTETGGPRGRNGSKAMGIIEAEGETLRLAYCYEGGIVPTEFKTKAGEKQLYFTMKRKAGK